MGFLTSCWDTFLFLSSFNPLNGFDRHQQPLKFPNDAVLNVDNTGLQTAGLTFTPPNSSITCQYPAGWQYCGSENTRACWIKNTGNVAGPSEYDINTDYENIWPTGVEREYFLTISDIPITPDGYLKPEGLVFNKTYPGPVLEACWGDTLKVHITNTIPTEGTTIHWHGIRQANTSQMDGVNGVTQCPIAPNQTFTYQFLVQQYGHTWYHSHYQTQYSDGLMGGLLIHGPSSANYDEAFDPILINDWVHDNTTNVLNQELVGGVPTANSIVLNGTGTYRCSDLDPFCCNNIPASCAPARDPRCPTSPATPTNRCPNPNIGNPYAMAFVPGKRYKLRLVNSSAGSMFLFSIDGHQLEVIATDLVAIKPYNTSSLFIGIGQRYQIIVTAQTFPAGTDLSNQNYWIRTRIAQGCGTVEQSDEETGILRYNPTATASPTTIPNDGRIACADEPASSLVPIVQWNVTKLDNAQTEEQLQNYSFLADISAGTFHDFNRWELTDFPLYLNYSNPSLLNLTGTLHDPNYAAIDYDFSSDFVVLVVDGINVGTNKTGKLDVPAAHPIHMHGHDFVILAQSDKTFNVSNALNEFNFTNPARRDVALLPAGGYLAMAFQPDNPGVWLVHCHIAWHASSGLALQIFERKEQILQRLGPLNASEETCKQWDAFGLKFNQTDSGI
ncbi:MAG: hypothetical protein M1820_008211 [Bogoriella megaspora]|nr:MAG: hypothetical protein M1820_008211 [Bogoriella megaspora]